ncbi:MAG TPA: S41 family peptidase [Solirubrobacteraceae bacterium]|nr:S41 family peptidase [Solirubrobacteraceae bacterium]
MRIAAAVIGSVLVLFGAMWLGGHSSLLPGSIQELVADDDIAELDDSLQRVEDDYYREVDRRALIDDALRGAISGLDDRFSTYLDAREYKAFRETPHFSGIGVTVVRVDDGLEIADVYEKSPARKAGLRAGDVIVAADGKALAGRPEEAATGLIKGPAGTTVRLTVERDGRRLRKRVERAEIQIPVVEAQRKRLRGKRFAHIHLATFAQRGAHAELYKELRKAERDKVDGIVLDLRGNPGGLVTEARLVASAFLPEGEIVTTRGRSVSEQVYRATGDPLVPKTPLVVLVDRTSASASEIVAGALQDRGRAKLVGGRTFGKGVFQEVVELANGGALHLTVGQYFLPSGRNLGGEGTRTGEGLEPDVGATDDPDTPRRDEALDRALAVLAG